MVSFIGNTIKNITRKLVHSKALLELSILAHFQINYIIPQQPKIKAENNPGNQEKRYELKYF